MVDIEHKESPPRVIIWCVADEAGVLGNRWLLI